MRNRICFLIGIAFALVTILSACTRPPYAPNYTIHSQELAGVWVAQYGPGKTDTLTLRADGTFRQVFEDTTVDYVFQTPWDKWNLESKPGGIIRVRLHGARYYLAGIAVAERDGRKDPKNPCVTPMDCTWGLEPFEYYDPFADTLIQMVDELALDVRVDGSGKLILHHLWRSSDDGFALFGGMGEFFQQISSSG
jgi:hypothetical protein